jgi:rhodanese-related sulfurtransferase
MIPYDTIGKNLDKLPADRSAKIVVYCRSGGMSAVAAEELVRLGYTQVSDLIGGMIDWQQTGHEVIQK